ncbi:MAG: NAD-dependent epimerase/dehydratase family protein, partial [uncultured Nocardioides sp.]
ATRGPRRSRAARPGARHRRRRLHRVDPRRTAGRPGGAVGGPGQPPPPGPPGLTPPRRPGRRGGPPHRRRHRGRGPRRRPGRRPPRRRHPPGGGDGHRPVAVGEHPSRDGQRRGDDPAPRRVHPGRSRPGPLRADELARGLRGGGVAPSRRDDLPAGAAHARPARGGTVGPRHGRGARAQLGRRDASPPDQRLRRHEAGPGADPGRVDRVPRHQAVGAAAPERLRAAPVAVQPLHGHRVAVLPARTGGTVDPALRGRRDHARLRLHRRRRERAGRGDGPAAGRPGPHRRRRQRRPHDHRRPGAGDRALPLRTRAARHGPVPRRRRAPRVVRGGRHDGPAGLEPAVVAARRRRAPAGVDRDPARL